MRAQLLDGGGLSVQAESQTADGRLGREDLHEAGKEDGCAMLRTMRVLPEAAHLGASVTAPARETICSDSALPR